MIIVADCGSTTVDWRITGESGDITAVKTAGVNFAVQGLSALERILTDNLSPFRGQVSRVYFYGAGITGHKRKEQARAVLARFFPEAVVHADSDMAGAAVALFGRGPGMACILGTGSTVCYYDGKDIVRVSRSGGFVLGDEGSGAYMGKVLLGDYVKGLLPLSLAGKLENRYDMDYGSIVANIYSGKSPSKYLASFSRFISENRGEPYVEELIRTSFDAFFERNRLLSEYPGIEIGFVGSVAAVYADILEERAGMKGLRVGRILGNAADTLAVFYRDKI